MGNLVNGNEKEEIGELVRAKAEEIKVLAERAKDMGLQVTVLVKTNTADGASLLQGGGRIATTKIVEVMEPVYY